MIIIKMTKHMDQPDKTLEALRESQDQDGLGHALRVLHQVVHQLNQT